MTPMSTGLSLFLAALAYALLSTGLVLMKKGIGWIGRWGTWDRGRRRELAWWAGGFALTNLYIVPSTMALKALEPQAVAAMGGWGVVLMVLLARAVLGEKLYASDAGYTVLVFAGIVLLNLAGPKGPGGKAEPARLAVAAAVPAILFAAAFIGGLRRKGRAVLLAAVSGLSTGMIIVLMKALVGFYGFRVTDYFSSPWFYLYLAFSLTAFLSLQLAYRMEALMKTGPVQYSLAIVYPAICSVAVFGNALSPAQAAAAALIVVSVVGILKRGRTKSTY